MNKFTCNPKCVKNALDIFGDKWSPLLVLSLCGGSKKFSEVEISLKGISPRTLSQRLDMLQEAEIITKKSYQESPIRYEYALTQKGVDLQKILKSMESWGQEHGTDLLETNDLAVTC